VTRDLPEYYNSEREALCRVECRESLLAATAAERFPQAAFGTVLGRLRLTEGSRLFLLKESPHVSGHCFYGRSEALSLRSNPQIGGFAQGGPKVHSGSSAVELVPILRKYERAGN
jgi:hypothetical protein